MISSKNTERARGEPYIKERRVRDNYPQMYEHVEYLYNQIKQIAEQQHPELKT